MHLKRASEIWKRNNEIRILLIGFKLYQALTSDILKLMNLGMLYFKKLPEVLVFVIPNQALLLSAILCASFIPQIVQTTAPITAPI